MVKEKTYNEIRIEVPICKADDEKRIVTGVVLEPNVVDAHEDWERAETIEKAAHNFLARYRSTSKIGVQHKVFPDGLELVESYVAPQDLTIGTDIIKQGSWVMSVRVLADEVWQLVKGGAITGFSIGGVATVEADAS